MIKEIYDYSLSNNLVENRNKKYTKRKLAAYIILNNEGKLLGIEKIAKKDKIETLCPDIGRKAQGTTISNIICEKANVIFSNTKKGLFYQEKIKELSEREPLFKAINVFLSNISDFKKFLEDNLSDIEKEYISFRVNNKNIEELDSWKDWYETFYDDLYHTPSKKEDKKRLSFITGQEITPIELMDQVKKVGLNATGDSLISFFSPAFWSYGYKKCENAPLSQEEVEIINAGFTDLCNNHSNNIGDSKIIHWYKTPKDDDAVKEIFEEKTDENDDLFFGEKETIEEKIERKNKAPIKLIKNIYDGKNTTIEDSDIYYSFVLTSNNGRIRILSNKEGSYTKLKENIKLWKEDMCIEKWNILLDRHVAPQKLAERLLAKESKDKSKEIKNEYGSDLIKLVYAIMDRTDIPDSFVKNAITNIKQSIYKDKDDNKDYYYRLLKAYLIRKGDNYIMPGLNKENPNIAYQCGRLFAVYDCIQQEAMPGNNTSTLERWYGAASTTPVIVFGPLARQTSIYYGKISDEKYKRRYEKMVREISDNIPEFPKTLNIQDQAQFSLGYYQQKNYIFKPKEKSEENKTENIINNKEETNNEE